MKWFKHNSDSSHNEFIIGLEAKFGLAGYARWFKILEQIANVYEKNGDCSVTLSWAEWQSFLKGKRNKLETFLKHCENESKMILECSGNILKIKIPKFKEIKDSRNNKRQAKGNIEAPQEVELEVELEVEKTTHTNTPQKTSCVSNLNEIEKHFSKLYFGRYGIRPEISWHHKTIFQNQLANRPAKELLALLEIYLADDDPKLMAKKHPIGWFPYRVDGLLARLKEFQDRKKQEGVRVREKEKENTDRIDLPTMTGDGLKVWEKCLEKIEDQVLPEIYQTWLAPVSPFGIKDGTLYLCAPNPFFKKCLQENYLKIICDNADEVGRVEIYYLEETKQPEKIKG